MANPNRPSQMTPPLVALTATTREIGGLMRVRLNEAYVTAARAAGLVPIVVPPLAPEAVPAILDAVSGVILTGGEDVDPARFGAARSATVSATHAARDECELAIARLARERSIPTLAICRGIQVVNVAFGGTLVQDIPAERPSSVNHDLSDARARRVHDIAIEPASRLAAIVGAKDIRVNSSHHQALDRVADGLTVTARAPDGIIEGAEWSGASWWMLGVQWHPEELTEDSAAWDRLLFSALANEAAAYQASFQRASSAT